VGRLAFGGRRQEKTTKIVFLGAMKNSKTIKNKGNMRKIFRSLKKRISGACFEKVVIYWTASGYSEKLQSLLSIKRHPM
jgi:hypothetical protein